MLKRLLLIGMCVTMLQVPSVFAAGGTQVVDTCDDFSKVFEKSNSWVIEDAKADSFAGDAGAFMRNDATETKYLTYNLPRVESAEIQYYYYFMDTSAAVKIKGSSDNAVWQEITTTKGTATTLSGSWKSVNIKTTSIPEGTKYIRIEIDSTANNQNWCGIGKVTLVQGESNYVNTPIPEVGEYTITEDDCVDFSMVYEKSANWRCETTADKFGETGRILKSADNADEYLIYKVSAAEKIDISINYSMKTDPFEFITVEASSDGVAYTEVEIPGGAPAGIGGGNWSTYTAQVTLPEGTEYIKISLLKTNYTAPWVVNFSKIKFYSAFPYEIKAGDVQFNENTANADYTVLVNYKVYDNITMFVAAYDEAGLLLNIAAETKPAEAGEVQLTKELTLPSGTAGVKVFFLNALQGMHRICETIIK